LKVTGADEKTYVIKPNADLSSADLRMADLSSADLRMADLSSARLWNANLSNADLGNADLGNADLGNADLSSADLSSANLNNAGLRKAVLNGAILKGVDLSTCFSVSQAFYDESTIFPEGFDPASEIAFDPLETYKAKNIVNRIWFLPLFFLIVDIIALGGGAFEYPAVLWAGTVGSLAGAFLAWLTHKDHAVSISGNTLLIKVGELNRKIEKGQITKYGTSRDLGKTAIKLYLTDNSEFEFSSYFLELEGFETAFAPLMADSVNEMESESEESVTDNSETRNITDDLDKLVEMKEKGILTDQEFEDAKKKLLA